MFSFRSRLALLLILAGLAACSDSTPNTSNTPDAPPAEPQVTALVVGDAASPFLDILSERMNTAQDDGSQKVADYDLVILDGDTHTPAALAEQPRINEALEQNKWVLVVDATEAHKQEGAAQQLGFGTQGDTDAYLFQSVPDTDMPVFDVMEMPPLLETKLGDKPLSDDVIVRFRDNQHRKFTDRVMTKLGSGTTPQQTTGCAPPLNIKAGILFTTWCYGFPNDWEIGSVSDSFNGNGREIDAGDTIAGNVVQTQQGQNDASFIFTLFLNNADVVTGNSQTLHVAANGQSTATTTTWPAGIADYLTGTPYLMGGWLGVNADDDVLAYPQAKLELTMEPESDVLTPAAIYAPQTPNNAQTDSYSSSTTFSIGATLNAGIVPDGGTGGGSVSGTYSTTSTNTTSRTITDWSWLTDPSGTSGYKWTFFSQSPYAGESTAGSEWDPDWFGNRNELNINLMQFSAEAVWTTSGVSEDTVSFFVESRQRLPALSNVLFTPLLLYNTDQLVGQTASIDLGTVIPVTLEPESLIFKDASGNTITESNPIKAGENVTATVDLSGPSPFSYTITSTASSTYDNAVITESPVRVTKGDSSKSFTIETNANSLASGGTVAVDVFLGSFGSTAAQQLWVSND